MSTPPSPYNTLLKYESKMLLLFMLSHCCIHSTLVQGFTPPLSTPRLLSTAGGDCSSIAQSSPIASTSISHSHLHIHPSSSSFPCYISSSPPQTQHTQTTRTTTSLQFHNAQYADDHLQSSNSHSRPLPSLPTTSDPYVLFGLPRHATAVDIKRAYRRAALMYHPDVRITANSSVEERRSANDDFARINAAYAILTGKATLKKGRRQQRPQSRPNPNSYGGTSNEYSPHSHGSHTRTSSSSSSSSRQNQNHRHQPPPHHDRRGAASNHANHSSGRGYGHSQAKTQPPQQQQHVHYNTNTNTHVPNQSQTQTDTNAHQHQHQHVRTHTHRPTAGTKYSRQGYGETNSAYDQSTNPSTTTAANHNHNGNNDRANNVNTQNTHRPPASTKYSQRADSAQYSRRGYGGTSSSYTQTQSGGVNASRYTSNGAPTSAHGVANTANANPQNTRRKATASTNYVRQEYGGTSSAYGAPASTPNPSRFKEEEKSTQKTDSTKPKQRATASTQYSNAHYGGTSSAYGAPVSTPNPSRFKDDEISTQKTDSAKPKRRATASTQYSGAHMHYGGTSSAYYGTAGKYSRTGKSNGTGSPTSVNARVNSSTNTSTDKPRAKASTKKYYGYGGTSSGFNGASASYTVGDTSATSNTPPSNPDLEERRKKGDFFDPERFHSQWNTSQGATVAGATASAKSNDSGKNNREKQEKSSVQSSYGVKTETISSSSGPFYAKPTVEKGKSTRRTVQIPKSANFLNTEDFHSKWNNSNSGTINKDTNRNTQQSTTVSASSSNSNPSPDFNASVKSRKVQKPMSANFMNTEDFHSKWNPSNSGTINKDTNRNTHQSSSTSGSSSKSNPSDFTNAQKFHSTYSSQLTAEEEEHKYKEDVIEAARMRAEEMTEKLKVEEGTKTDDNLSGLNGIFKSMTNLFNNNAAQAPPTASSKAPQQKMTKVPRPPQGHQYTPFQACTIIEQHERDPALDKPEAMRVMLINHYVPVRKSQLYNVYKKYQQGRILRDNRWGQY